MIPDQALICLVIFLFILSAGCGQKQAGELVINHDHGKAVSVSIPANISDGIPADSILTLVHVVIKGYPASAAMIGEFTAGNGLLFKPLIPFSPGMSYDVLIRNQVKTSFTIPANTGENPEIVAVYPGNDTLPVNLLKIYLQFSHPMQEGRSAGFIRLVKNGTDTMHDVFLDLQPELWNTDRTVLTVWLDPGRIKRDLQPNLRMGAPLETAGKYELVILKGWKDAASLSIQSEHHSQFITAGRDSLGPDPAKWLFTDTTTGSKKMVAISFGEPLDHFLLMDCLSVTDESGIKIKGSFIPVKKDAACLFVPEKPMVKGRYILVVASRLEDLAGNNVNRPFDRDIKKTAEPSAAVTHSRVFIIR